MKVAASVSPNRRRHAIGKGSHDPPAATAVTRRACVSAPPAGPHVLRTNYRGAPRQAGAVALQITRHLQAGEEKLRKGEQRRQERKSDGEGGGATRHAAPRGGSSRRDTEEAGTGTSRRQGDSAAQQRHSRRQCEH